MTTNSNVLMKEHDRKAALKLARVGLAPERADGKKNKLF